MESMKGHKDTGNQGEQFKVELTKCNTTPFHTDFVFAFCHSFRWYQFKPQTQGQISQPQILLLNKYNVINPDLGPQVNKWSSLGFFFIIINMVDLVFVL